MKEPVKNTQDLTKSVRSTIESALAEGHIARDEALVQGASLELE